MSSQREEKTMGDRQDDIRYEDDPAVWASARREDAVSGQRDEEPTVVQVRLPGAARTYAYTVPHGWDAVAVGDWVAVPGNQVSPDGGKGRVESFGRDAYKGPLKELVHLLEPQDPWLVRMEVVRSSKEANTVWQAAKEAQVGPDRMRRLRRTGSERLAAVKEEQASRARWRTEREQR
jgi:hypothetical protein